MSIRSLNGLTGDTTNVYVNTIDTFEGTLPVEVTQAGPNQAVDIALKGISSFGGAGKILEINASNNALQWADQSWKRIASAYLQPADITDIVSIPPDSYIRFDCEPVSTLGFELKHDQTGNYFVFREKDGTQIYKYTPTADAFNPQTFEFGATDNEKIIFTGNDLRLNNRGIVSFREDASNGTSQINLQAPASLTTSATITLPSSNGTLALVGQGGFITSVSSPLAVSSNNLTLGTIPTTLGGTNITSYTQGDLIFGSGTNLLARLLIGSTGQVLKVSSGGIPEWGTDNAENITVALPLERTGDSIALKGLSSIGSAGKIIKVNSGGTALEYADDNNTTYTAQSPLTLSSTEFQLNTVPYNKGGTGLTSYTEGDLLYASADNVLSKLAHGNAGDILRMNGVGTLPEWRTMYGATSPITLTGGTTFELGVVPYNLGGTGQSGYNAGDMLYSLGVNNLTKINIGTAGQVLKVASGTAKPEWADETDTQYTSSSPIFLAGTNFSLTTIPISLGGTNIVSYTQGDLLYCSSSTGQGTLSKLPIGSTGEFLKVSGGVPVWGSDNNTEYTAQTPLTLSGTEFQLGVVPYNKGGTGQSSWTQGDLLYASADNTLAKLAHGNAGDILRMNGTGTIPEWRTMYSATSPIVLTGGLTFELTTIPVSKGGTGFTGCNAGDMIYSLVNNTLTKLNIGSTGQVLKVSGGLPVWSAETDTTYSGTGNIDITGTTISLTGTIPQSNGGTGFNTYTAGDILYCDTTNTLSKLPIGTTGQLLSVASGKPAWGTFTGGTKWSVFTYTYGGQSQEVIYPTTSTQRVAIGYTTNPSDRRLYVNGDTETDQLNCNVIQNQSGGSLVRQYTATGNTMFGNDSSPTCSFRTDDKFDFDLQGVLGVRIQNDGNTSATTPNRATDGIYNYLEYFSCNHSSHFSPSGGRTIGFTSYLGTQGNSYTNSNYPVLSTQYGNLYVSTDNDSQVSGDRTGGYYSAYFNSSGVNNVSDSRLKKEVETIPNPLEIINKLRGVYFKWNDGRSEERQTGFIAQEVNEVFTEVVDYDEEPDVYAMRYDKITGLLTEGIKAVDKENTELKAEIDTLKTEVSGLKEIINQLINSKSFAEFKKNVA